MKQLFKSVIVAILRLESKLVLLRYRPSIITVTGSVGKTSTKDAIFAVMSEHFYAHKSKKSYNSELGLPLTILMSDSGWTNPLLWVKNIINGLALIVLKNHYPKWLVLEVGIDRPGDMKRATRLIKSQIAVFTKFPDVPVHVEYFKTPEAVHEEKWKLANSVVANGTIVVNNDDPILREKIKEVKDNIHIITYGISEDATICASNIHIVHANGVPEAVTFKVSHEGNNVPIKLNGVLGMGYVYSALAAIAVGVSQGLNLVQIGEALSSLEAPPGRLRILEGVRGSVLIDDTYNASPEAARLALCVLRETEGTRKIAVLGDMLELGKFTVEEHKALGERVAESGIDLLYVVGPRSKHIADGANRKPTRISKNTAS